MDVFKDGILYIVVPVFLAVIELLIKLFTDGLKDISSIVFKRIKKYAIIAAIITSLYWIILGFLNRELQFRLSNEESIQYLVIFLTTIGILYGNAVVSTFIMWILNKFPKIVEIISPQKVEYARAIIMVIVASLLFLLLPLLGNIISLDRNVLVQDVIVKYNCSNYKLLKGTYFEFNYKPNNKSEQKSEYDFVTKGTEFIIAKGTTINIFSGTKLKLEDESVRKVDFLNKEKIADAIIYTTNNSTIQLKEDELVVLEGDALVNLNQTNENLNLFFFQFQVIDSLLLLYYIGDAYKRR